MSKRIKVFLPALIAAVLLVMGATCFAADSDYQFDIDTGTITKYQGSDSVVTIPDTIAGYPVKVIGYRAFYENDTITSLTINSNIEEIGEGAFENMGNLKSVTINAGTLYIDYEAFAGTSVETLTMTCTNTLTFREANSSYGVFDGCKNLKSVTLPKGTQNIGGGMFAGAENLETIIIPDTVTSIGESAFERCTSLKNVAIPNSVTVLGSSAFAGCTALEKISIPDGVIGKLKQDTFRGCTSLKDLQIGSGITQIGQWSLSLSGLEELTLPLNIDSIEPYGLIDLDSLSKLTIMNDEIELNDEIQKLPKTCEIYCGADSNGLKAAIGAGLKYVIIETPSAVPVEDSTAVVSSQRLYVNGTAVDAEAYNINDSNYFKLRDIAYLLNGTPKQFSISYNDSTNSISLTTGAAYSPVGSELVKNNVTEIYATPSIAAITLNGTAVYPQAYTINGNNYFKLRDLASRMDFGVEYDEATDSINIVTSTGYTE